MRLNVRFKRAYDRFIATPRVRQRIVLFDDLHPPIKPREERPKHEEMPPERVRLFETTQTTKVPAYDWKWRRDGVLKRFKNVKNWVLPAGYVPPYEPKYLPGKSLNQHEREKELTYLIETQEMDLAPMYEEFAANGIRVAQQTYVDEGDEEIHVMPAEDDANTDMMALAHQYEIGRKEEFAKQVDYADHHTGAPKRAQVSQSAQGPKIRPLPGNQWTKEELVDTFKRWLAKKNDRDPDTTLRVIEAYLDEIGIGHNEETFEIEDQIARYEAEHGGYQAGDPCPDSFETGADGRPACIAGRIRVTIDGITDFEDDCPTCNGTGSIMSMLGIDLPAEA